MDEEKKPEQAGKVPEMLFVPIKGDLKISGGENGSPWDVQAVLPIQEATNLFLWEIVASNLDQEIKSQAILSIETINKYQITHIDFSIDPTKGKTGEVNFSVYSTPTLTDEDAKKLKNMAFAYVLAKLNKKEEELFSAWGHPKKIEIFRTSAQLIDQKLKYTRVPKNKSQDQAQLDLWNSMSPNIQSRIEDAETIVEGIKLSPGEEKLITTLNVLLHQYSQTSNPKELNTFYSGNEPAEKVPYGPIEAIAPKIRIKPSLLYREFKNGKTPSGEDIREINGILEGLLKKEFYIRYQRVTKSTDPKKEDRIERIEMYQPLLRIANYYEILRSEADRIDKGDIELREEKREFIISLNPIFRDQIETRYIKFPQDINRRMAIAQGSHGLPQRSTTLLRDYLMRELTNKRYTAPIDYETLIYQLDLGKYQREGRKSLIKRNIKKAIEVNIKLGLLLKHEETTGAKGQRKVIFHINRDFV